MAVKLKPGLMVALDTSPLIYLIEQHADYSEPVRLFLDACMDKGVDLGTSIITYIEVLTHPGRLGRRELAARYRNFLTNSERLTIYPLTIQVADACIRLRAKYGFRTPDAIQLAVAITCGASLFLTNDSNLKRCEDIDVMLVSEISEAL